MGSYAETLLAPGEVIVHRSHQHWLSLLLESRLAIVLWAISIAGIVLWLWNQLGDGINAALGALTVVTLILGIVVVGWRWWHWRTEEYVITNRRLLKVTGIINKRSGDSSLEKINDAILEENLIGRLLDYGDLDILTAAEIAVDRYRMLAKAKDFKKKMLEAKHSLESGMAYGDISTQRAMDMGAAQGAAQAAPTAPAQPAGPAPLADPVDTAEEVTAALARLAELRDQGAITANDFEIKKRDLLSRL